MSVSGVVPRSLRVLPLFLVLAGSLATPGCTQEVEQQVSFEPIVDSRQMMNWILDPNADVIWGSAGTITTFEGVEDLTPTTQEGWDAVRNAAATLAEAGNLLKIPGVRTGTRSPAV